MIADVRLLANRHCSAVAAAVLGLTVAGTGAAIVAAQAFTGTPNADAGDLVNVACQILPYGVVGAVLVARRPDLPFGWLLSLGAMALTTMLAVAGTSIYVLDHEAGGQLAVWGLTAGALLFVPAAIEGLVNVRFPAGAPAGRWGRRLDRAIVVGILVGVTSGVLGDSVVRAIYPDGPPGGATRFIDGTPVVTLGNLAVVAVPVVILLGALAGLGVVVRFVRATGIERKQLEWRAVGVLGALLLFPFAVAEVLPDVVFDITPLWFVATLVVPVMRYDLWAIDSIVRRSAVDALTSPASVVQNLVRATAEMLRLPYVAVRHGDQVLASYGEPGEAGRPVETWPLEHDGTPAGELVAAPRHGFATISDQDSRVLATLARLVGGSVHAELLTADLRDARRHLVRAREEERRRLRRDLHDGLGPLLTGLGLNLDAAAAQLERSPTKSAAYLGHARAASTEVIASLRELVDGLRPPALDELGLAGALKLRVERLAADAGLTLELRCASDLALPAAVEVAAYRTVVEAVTNAARHGHARRVRVDLAVQAGLLVVTVGDDGPSAAAWHPGVGLIAMRERAEELGGTLDAGPTPTGGLVHATYPLGSPP